jgi:twinkle protein
LNREKSNFLHHDACSDCGSSDGLAVHDDGHTYCHVCKAYNGNYKETDAKVSRKERVREVTPTTDVFRAIPRRGLTEPSVRKYGIDVCMDKTQDVAHRYPYVKDGKHVANKVRKRSEKAFYYEGDPHDAELFGQQLFPAGSAKSITVTEGEIDAASAFQLTGSRYPVVSVLSGGSAVKDCKRNYSYLDSFDEIVLCFDNDEVGRDNSKKVAELFKPGKVRVMALSEGKDASQYLQEGIDAKVFVNEWWRAPVHTPQHIVMARDMLPQLLNPPSYASVPYPWESVNKQTYGIRLSEVVLFMADTGIGKTSFFKEIAYSILNNPEAKAKGHGVGFLHLEETTYDTALGLVSIHLNKPLHLPDTDRTAEEIISAHDHLFGDNRAIMYDSFGSNDIDVIVSKCRQMAAMGCRYLLLDHLSIVVSDQSGDERKQLDEVSTKLKTLCMEQDIAILCVIHTNRSGQARGSAGPEKIANTHFSLHRDKKDPDEFRRNVTRMDLEKCRLTGRTGPCAWIYYDPATGRLSELDAEGIAKYESGETMSEATAW